MKKGKELLGFPTANIQPSDDYLLPRKGVYAVSIEIGTQNKLYRGVANIGVKQHFMILTKQKLSSK